MMRNIILLFFFSSILLVAVGCKGEKGDTGNANVKTIIFDVTPDKWQGDTNGYVTTLEIPEITENIYSNGAVLVYMLSNENTSNKSFNKLPYTWIYNYETEYMDYTAFVGKLEISYRWVDDKKNNTSKPGSVYTFKVIVIEGMQISALKNKVDIGNVNAVMAFLSQNEPN